MLIPFRELRGTQTAEYYLDTLKVKKLLHSELPRRWPLVAKQPEAGGNVLKATGPIANHSSV